MVVLIFAAAWLGNEGVRNGFAPWEKITVFTLLMLPALSIPAAWLLGLQIAPILLWLTMAVILRRGLTCPSPSFARTSSFALHHGSRSPV
jgi:hypothetical protein